jgi:hypothetical protein
MPETQGDLLLYALSAWRATTWQTFATAADEVAARSTFRNDGRQLSATRSVSARMLGALGHVDIASDHGALRVWAAPPTLARLPNAGLPRAVLCGGRSPGTETQLRHAVRRLRLRLRDAESYAAFAPKTFVVESDAEEDLAALAARLNVAYTSHPPAHALALQSGTLEAYLGSLSWTPSPELNWRRVDFDVSEVRFTSGAAPAPSSLRLSRYLDPIRGTSRYLLWNGSAYATVDRNWGRYAALSAAGRDVIQYNDDRWEVTVPLGAPLPRLLERSLVLCTGRPPTRRETEAVDVYGRVPAEIFRTVRDKLRVHGGAA